MPVDSENSVSSSSNTIAIKSVTPPSRGRSKKQIELAMTLAKYGRYELSNYLKHHHEFGPIEKLGLTYHSYLLYFTFSYASSQFESGNSFDALLGAQLKTVNAFMTAKGMDKLAQAFSTSKMSMSLGGILLQVADAYMYDPEQMHSHLAKAVSHAHQSQHEEMRREVDKFSRKSLYHMLMNPFTVITDIIKHFYYRAESDERLAAIKLDEVSANNNALPVISVAPSSGSAQCVNAVSAVAKAATSSVTISSEAIAADMTAHVSPLPVTATNHLLSPTLLDTDINSQRLKLAALSLRFLSEKNRLKPNIETAVSCLSAANIGLEGYQLHQSWILTPNDIKPRLHKAITNYALMTLPLLKRAITRIFSENGRMPVLWHVSNDLLMAGLSMLSGAPIDAVTSLYDAGKGIYAVASFPFLSREQQIQVMLNEQLAELHAYESTQRYQNKTRILRLQIICFLRDVAKSKRARDEEIILRYYLQHSSGPAAVPMQTMVSFYQKEMQSRLQAINTAIGEGRQSLAQARLAQIERDLIAKPELQDIVTVLYAKTNQTTKFVQKLKQRIRSNRNKIPEHLIPWLACHDNTDPQRYLLTKRQNIRLNGSFKQKQLLLKGLITHGKHTEASTLVEALGEDALTSGRSHALAWNLWQLAVGESNLAVESSLRQKILMQITQLKSMPTLSTVNVNSPVARYIKKKYCTCCHKNAPDLNTIKVQAQLELANNFAAHGDYAESSNWCEQAIQTSMLGVMFDTQHARFLAQAVAIQTTNTFNIILQETQQALSVNDYRLAYQKAKQLRGHLLVHDPRRYHELVAATYADYDYFAYHFLQPSLAYVAPLLPMQYSRLVHNLQGLTGAIPFILPAIIKVPEACCRQNLQSIWQGVRNEGIAWGAALKSGGREADPIRIRVAMYVLDRVLPESDMKTDVTVSLSSLHSFSQLYNLKSRYDQAKAGMDFFRNMATSVDDVTFFMQTGTNKSFYLSLLDGDTRLRDLRNSMTTGGISLGLMAGEHLMKRSGNSPESGGYYFATTFVKFGLGMAAVTATGGAALWLGMAITTYGVGKDVINIDNNAISACINNIVCAQKDNENANVKSSLSNLEYNIKSATNCRGELTNDPKDSDFIRSAKRFLFQQEQAILLRQLNAALQSDDNSVIKACVTEVQAYLRKRKFSCTYQDSSTNIFKHLQILLFTGRAMLAKQACMPGDSGIDQGAIDRYARFTSWDPQNMVAGNAGIPVNKIPMLLLDRLNIVYTFTFEHLFANPGKFFTEFNALYPILESSNNENLLVIREQMQRIAQLARVALVSKCVFDNNVSEEIATLQLTANSFIVKLRKISLALHAQPSFFDSISSDDKHGLAEAYAQWREPMRAIYCLDAIADAERTFLTWSLYLSSVEQLAQSLIFTNAVIIEKLKLIKAYFAHRILETLNEMRLPLSQTQLIETHCRLLIGKTERLENNDHFAPVSLWQPMIKQLIERQVFRAERHTFCQRMLGYHYDLLFPTSLPLAQIQTSISQATRCNFFVWQNEQQTQDRVRCVQEPTHRDGVEIHLYQRDDGQLHLFSLRGARSLNQGVSLC